MYRARRLSLILTLVAGAVVVPAHWGTAATTISFGVAGDMGANSTVAASLAKLDDSDVNFFMAIGDLSYGQTATPSLWCDYVKSHLPKLGASFPFELVSGNHEDTEINQYTPCLPDRLGAHIGPGAIYGGEYYFDYPSTNPLVRVLMLSPKLSVMGSTYSYTKGSAHYNFVAGAIDDARARGIPWTVAGWHMTSPDTDLVNLLVSKKVDLAVYGHNHDYNRGDQLMKCPTGTSFSCVSDNGVDGAYPRGGGTVFVLNGSFGQGSPNGFTKVTLTADRLDAKFVASSPSSFNDTWSITPNRPPTIEDPGDRDDAEGRTVNLPISAADPEGDPLTFTATGLPPGLSINATTGVISGTLAAGGNENSPYAVVVKATDRFPLTSTVGFNWVVRDLTAPVTPDGLSLVKTTTGVLLDWPDNTEADLAGYGVLRSDTPSGPFEPVTDSLLARSNYFDDSAAPGARSYYEIRAVDRRGNESSPVTGNVLRSKIRLVGTSEAKGSGMTLVIRRPAGTAPGDVLLSALAVRGSDAVQPPSGWTLVSRVTHTPSLSHQAIYRHTVQSSEPASYTFRVVGRSSTVATIVAYRGAAERPAASGGLANPASVAITAPSVSSSKTDSVQIAFFGIARDTSIVPPAGMMEREECVLGSGPLRVTMELSDSVVAAQALGTRVATAGSAARNMGQVVVLSPAP